MIFSALYLILKEKVYHFYITLLKQKSINLIDCRPLSLVKYHPFRIFITNYLINLSERPILKRQVCASYYGF